MKKWEKVMFLDTRKKGQKKGQKSTLGSSENRENPPSWWWTTNGGGSKFALNLSGKSIKKGWKKVSQNSIFHLFFDKMVTFWGHKNDENDDLWSMWKNDKMWKSEKNVKFGAHTHISTSQQALLILVELCFWFSYSQLK